MQEVCLRKPLAVAIATVLLSGVAWVERSEALNLLPPGTVTVYFGTGLRSSGVPDAAVEVFCTSYVAPGPAYPFDVKVEFYGYNGVIEGTLTMGMLTQDQTRTVGTRNTAMYVEDDSGTFNLDQGSLRIYAPKGVASQILCSATQTSEVDPAAYQSDIPLTRIGKFKAPKDAY